MLTDKKKYMVVAHDDNLGIGIDNKLPWHYRSDMAFFKRLTCDRGALGKDQNVVIMGRKTWDSIPLLCRPFKDRINVVISRTLPENDDFDISRINVYSSLDKAFEMIDNAQLDSKIFIIGGAQIYKAAMLFDDIDVIATTIKSKFVCDTFFPEYRKIYKLHSILDIKDDELDVRVWKRLVDSQHLSENIGN